MCQDFPQAAARARRGNPAGEPSTGLASGTHSAAAPASSSSGCGGPAIGLLLMPSGSLLKVLSLPYGDSGDDAIVWSAAGEDANPSALAELRVGISIGEDSCDSLPSLPAPWGEGCGSPFQAPGSTIRLPRTVTSRSRDLSAQGHGGSLREWALVGPATTFYSTQNDFWESRAFVVNTRIKAHPEAEAQPAGLWGGRRGGGGDGDFKPADADSCHLHAAAGGRAPRPAGLAAERRSPDARDGAVWEQLQERPSDFESPSRFLHGQCGWRTMVSLE